MNLNFKKIFNDVAKNVTNETSKKLNQSNSISTKKVKFDKLFTSKSEISTINRTDYNNVVALLVHTLCNYDPNNLNNFQDMLQYLLGENQPLLPITMQRINDKMMENERYKYIGKSYFTDATPNNDYNTQSYEVEIIENSYSNDEPGIKKLFIKSGGADSPRSINVRLAKDGNYYVYSDSFINLLSDIKIPESKNNWA